MYSGSVGTILNMSMCFGSRLVAALLLCVPKFACAQQTPVDSRSEPWILKAPISEYPPIARAARVSGAVHLRMMIGSDNKVESVEVVDGPPMLRPASIAAAKSLLFDCSKCTDASMPYELTVRYEIMPTDPPKDCDAPIPQGSHVAVNALERVVTISTPQIWTCDPAVEISMKLHRVRAARCMYLWRCAWRSEN